MATNSSAFELRRARSKEDSGSPTARFGHPVVLLTTTISALLVVGIVMILSASSVQSFANYGSSFVFFKKQLVSVALGLAAFFVAYRIDYRRLKGFGYLLLPAVALLLLVVLLPGFGVTVSGSQRWMRLGFTDFQPSELAKFALILFAADVFARKEESTFLEFSHTAIPMLPAIGILAGLIMMQPDLGTAILLALIAIGMLFVAGAPLRHIIPIGFLGAGLAIMAGLAAPYRRERILAFMDPWKDPLESGYHAIQSMIALGSGGFFGVGLGASRQKWSYIPNAHTDFIYAIIGEELGLLGTFGVLGLFLFLAFMGIRTAVRAPDRFGMLLASGITIWISLQSLVNMGAVTSSLPITGVPLPLVSFGGTSLVVSLAAMGVLLNIAKQGEDGPTPRHRRAGPARRDRRNNAGPARRDRRNNAGP
ncbi:MAG: putative lipid II flippase FtsW, partial [Actinobacteria bacterium]|nr:putative lipid II flippase FtsW [Actinomycetota bacterium]